MAQVESTLGYHREEGKTSEWNEGIITTIFMTSSNPYLSHVLGTSISICLHVL